MIPPATTLPEITNDPSGIVIKYSNKNTKDLFSSMSIFCCKKSASASRGRPAHCGLSIYAMVSRYGTGYWKSDASPLDADRPPSQRKEPRTINYPHHQKLTYFFFTPFTTPFIVSVQGGVGFKSAPPHPTPTQCRRAPSIKQAYR